MFFTTQLTKKVFSKCKSRVFSKLSLKKSFCIIVVRQFQEEKDLFQVYNLDITSNTNTLGFIGSIHKKLFASKFIILKVIIRYVFNKTKVFFIY